MRRIHKVVAKLLSGLFGVAVLASVSGAATPEPYKIALSGGIETFSDADSRLVDRAEARFDDTLLSDGALNRASKSDGDEESECIPYGRASSSLGEVTLNGSRPSPSSIRITGRVLARAAGGHFRRCAFCQGAEGSTRCVGIFPKDTRATSSAEMSARVVISFEQDDPMRYYFLRVSLLPAGEGSTGSLTLKDEGGNQINLKNAAGEPAAVPAVKGANYILEWHARAQAAGTGGANAKHAEAGELTVEVEAAPALYGFDLMPYIKGGKFVNIKDLNEVVALTKNDMFACSGTVISRRTVLTAGHCVYQERAAPQSIRVVFGKNAMDPAGQIGSVPVTKIWIPDEVDGLHFRVEAGRDSSGKMLVRALEDDIALLVLERDIDVFLKDGESYNINPFLYDGAPAPEAIKESGRALNFVGFGFDVVDGSLSAAGVKREAAWEIAFVDQSTFRYSGGEKGVCEGDSGGPALWYDDTLPSRRYVVAGVTSMGFSRRGYDSDCQAAISTRVDRFADWISQYIDKAS